jgi:hypothetical protein
LPASKGSPLPGRRARRRVKRWSRRMPAVGSVVADDRGGAVRLARLGADTGLRMPDCCVLLAAQDASARVAALDDQRIRAAEKLRLVALRSKLQPERRVCINWCPRGDAIHTHTPATRSAMTSWPSVSLRGAHTRFCAERCSGRRTPSGWGELCSLELLGVHLGQGVHLGRPGPAALVCPSPSETLSARGGLDPDAPRRRPDCGRCRGRDTHPTTRVAVMSGCGVQWKGYSPGCSGAVKVTGSPCRAPTSKVPSSAVTV